MNKARQNPLHSFAAHAALITWTVIALFPVVVTLINSFKTRRAIFREPLALPSSDSCAAGSWYQQLRVADDDDADLANGTPHADI
mgnify:CR=1 FL=1